MSKQVQFKVSIIAATISMMMTGSAFAATGNELVGPDVNTTGTATVKIDQSGTGNITSKTGSTGGGAFIVDQSAGATTALTIQQVGTDNTLGLSSYTNAATSIQVFQGMDKEADNTGGLTGVTKEVDANEAVIEIGKDVDNRAEASDVFLTQQGNSNVAGLHLGKTAGVFTGILNLMQVGDSNTADVTINGQTTTGQTFNIGQSGPGNSLTLVADGDQTNGMTLDFGGVTFDRTVALPTATDAVGSNNAKTYTYNTAGANAGLKALFGVDAQIGINLLGTDAFKIKALGGTNQVQVDLSTAAGTGNKVDVNLNDGASKFAAYGKGGAAVNLGGSGTLNVNDGKELVAYANGGTVSVNGVTFDGNGYFSTAAGGSITMSGGTVTANGVSVLQSDAAHTFSSTNDAASSATWNVNQTGPVVSSIIANNTAAGATAGTFALTQTSETGGGAHAMTLNNSAASTTWTATQTGAGAKTLIFTNSTPSATITATQTGANTQTATGIDFTAASGSFTLVQR